MLAARACGALQSTKMVWGSCCGGRLQASPCLVAAPRRSPGLCSQACAKRAGRRRPFGTQTCTPQPCRVRKRPWSRSPCWMAQKPWAARLSSPCSGRLCSAALVGFRAARSCSECLLACRNLKPRSHVLSLQDAAQLQQHPWSLQMESTEQGLSTPIY